MAQALYDYWFVQFDFPDENGKPYKSSGGKMVRNEMLKREIPEGWTCVTIQEMADVIGGSTPYTQDPDNFSKVNESGIPWITPKDLSKSTDFYIAKGEVSITEKGRKEASLTYLPPGSILFSSRAPIGYVAIAADYVTTNQGFKSLAPLESESTPYLFFLMKSMVSYFEQAAGITTFKEISGSQVKAAKIVRPPVSVLQKFFEVTEPIMNRRKATETEIKALTQQRDFLLPLLMNGQVQVKPLNYRLYPLLVA
ncbi:MAG: restriction endonuclease subunit S [Akkermansia sp.]|nr:restriction endonuclease subunit S [Akkermansia sp.]